MDKIDRKYMMTAWASESKWCYMSIKYYLLWGADRHMNSFKKTACINTCRVPIVCRNWSAGFNKRKVPSAMDQYSPACTM